MIARRRRQRSVPVRLQHLHHRLLTSRSFARSSGRVGRFLSIGPRLCSTLLSDATSRRRLGASLTHQAGSRTSTSKLSFTLGTQKKGPLAEASGPSLGRKRPRRAAIAENDQRYRTAIICRCKAPKARGAVHKK